MAKSGDVGERLEAVRALATIVENGRERVLSARELSMLAGFKPACAGLIESGRREDPMGSTVAGFAEVLGCTTDYLITGKGEAPTVEQVRAAVAAARARLVKPTEAA